MVREFGSSLSPYTGTHSSYRQPARANVALKRAHEAARSGAPTTNIFFAVAIWTCAAAGAPLTDELAAFRAMLLQVAKSVHSILDELLVLVAAVGSVVLMSW